MNFFPASCSLNLFVQRTHSFMQIYRYHIFFVYKLIGFFKQNTTHPPETILSDYNDLLYV